ncbi:MAG: hypothetical protein KF746_25775 [Chitinophagaceae bacterium]|nr:hypothetical protein [Chitinophagaceae bacterium]
MMTHLMHFFFKYFTRQSVQVNRQLILIICICTFCLHRQGYAQPVPTETLQKQFTSYIENNLTEKIYLSSDRNFYVSGEIMWFKAYIVNDAFNQLSGFSKVAYVDVINESNKPFLQAKIALTGGTGNGSLYLPLNFPSGKYKIRAYTNWMKNFDPAFYFEKPVTIVNTLSAARQPVPDATHSNEYDIQFFPEGGNLISNIESRIAFRVTDKYGKGIQPFKGVVVNDQKDTLVTFSPYAFGIGNFLFTARRGENYTAVIQLPSGEMVTKKLPGALEAGYAMRLQKNTAGQITIAVETENIPVSSTLYLFAHTRGVIKQSTMQATQNNKAVFAIAPDVPGEGITHFTIFDSNRQPVCERIYFKPPAGKLAIAGGALQQKYGTRKKITIELSSNDTGNKAQPANMSLSVFRVDSLQAGEPADIYSYLWLSSDIKGLVESPNWYFTASRDSTAIGIDNLMLTHGWRRFKWQDVQRSTRPAFTFLPEYDGHIINGKIFDTASRKPFAESVVYLSIPGIHTQFYTAISDREGNVRFYTRNAYGPGEMILQGEGLNGFPYQVEITSPFSEKYSDHKLPPFTISESMERSLLRNSINAQVLRKFSTEQIRQYRFPDVDTSAFYGKPDEKYLLDDYTRFTTMEEVLREYVLGVLVGRSGGKFRLTSLDIPNNRLFKDNPLVLLDAMPVLDIDKIMQYDPLKVYKIEVVKRRYYYGPLMFDGILNMTTYKGTLEDFPMDPRATILDFDGLQLQREFYSPVYETGEQQKSRLADYRNLLYWSPDIIADKDGRCRVSFYSNDLPGKYKGVVEGMTAGGKAGSHEFLFEID